MCFVYPMFYTDRCCCNRGQRSERLFSDYLQGLKVSAISTRANDGRGGANKVNIVTSS